MSFSTIAPSSRWPSRRIARLAETGALLALLFNLGALAESDVRAGNLQRAAARHEEFSDVAAGCRSNRRVLCAYECRCACLGWRRGNDEVMCQHFDRAQLRQSESAKQFFGAAGLSPHCI